MMQRVVLVIAIVSLASVAFAQGPEGMPPGMGMGQGPGMRGGGMGGPRGMMRSPLEQLKEVLAKANVPLSSDQEKKLKPIAEEQMKQREEMMERMRGQGMGGGRGEGRGERRGGGQAGPGGPEGGPGGGRGMGGPMGGPMGDAMRRMNEDFQAKVSPILTPAQQEAWQKFQNEQVMQRGGYEALKLTLTLAGSPITAEQEPQIQSLYQEMNQQRGEMFRGMQGPPSPERRAEMESKMKELEAATLAKVVKLLNPAQRKALLESRKKQASQP